MECEAWAAKHARRADEEVDISENLDEEVDQEMENEDGILPEAEKEALRKMVLVNVLANPSQETGDEEVLGGEHGRGEERDGLNEAPRIAALRQILAECSPMSLRHRQAARVLEKRLDDKVRMQDWHRETHRQRQQQLVARGVTREHAELLPEDASDPLPTPIMEDLADFRRQSLREDIVTRRTKAREAFQGPWLQSTERELHETTVNLLTADIDSQARASLEAYQFLLQERLKQHHQNLGFNLDCTIALEERKRACVALGLLSKEHRDLVTTLFQTLPTADEVVKPSEVASEKAIPSPVDNNEKNSDDEARLFITQVPASPAPTLQVRIRNTAPVCSTSKRKKRRSTGNVENQAKKPRNSILNYFLRQN